MTIWVCFKVQPDFDQVLEADWHSFNPDSDISYVSHTINCFDESSLEIALRLKEAMTQSNRPVYLGAVTVAPSLRAPLVKSLYAAGFDEVQRIDARAEFSPATSGQLLAAELSLKKPDLVLAGQQAGYADTGLVPYYIAEALGLPILHGVENILWEENGLTMLQTCDDLRRKLSIRPPLVAVVGNSPVTTLRASTLRQQMETGKKSVTISEVMSHREAQAPILAHKRPTRNTNKLEAADSNAAADAILNILRKELRQ